MNPFAFLAVLFGTVAILAVFIGLIHYDRAELLSETLQEHTIATQALIAHMDATNRYNRAVAAGFMLTVGAVDVAERMHVEGEAMP